MENSPMHNVTDDAVGIPEDQNTATKGESTDQVPTPAKHWFVAIIRPHSEKK